VCGGQTPFIIAIILSAACWHAPVWGMAIVRRRQTDKPPWLVSAWPISFSGRGSGALVALPAVASLPYIPACLQGCILLFLPAGPPPTSMAI